MKKTFPDAAEAATLIDARIAELAGWRGDLLAHLRKIVTRTSPDIVEEWKWRVPVWSCHGILCTGEAYKATVKMTFPKGASLPDPTHLFNASLEGNTRRAIDFHEGDPVDEKALTQLIQAAIKANQG
ncbi:hypothetical protein UC34_17550 [Pandoraea vervacti]|uniref:YdhG-like domain-containing protein n=1 Tax=Pandoraea vervacti TaxID=656178 RepID=A0ABM5T058_9BURK|nr:DUF1801 domain-containing protein [Pandoraea vervacti]AJP58283.1 hypothetical protein UC34_17550 [Pandoraea vervacti]